MNKVPNTITLNKLTRILLVFLLVGLLIYNIYSVYGFINLFYILVSYYFFSHLNKYKTSRKEINGIIKYNTNKWPFLLGIILVLIFDFGLYQILIENSISKLDYLFGLIFIIIYALIPLCYFLKVLINRKDFIAIGQDGINYKDNDIISNIEYSEILNIKVESGIMILLINGTTCHIKTGQMNLNSKNLEKITNDIKYKNPHINIENKLFE